MKRRFAAFFAAWYLWLGLGGPFPTPASLPPAEASIAAEFPCAGHACGCGTAEDCRRHCCCFPHPAEQSRSQVPVEHGLSFRSAMSCQGQETGGPVVSSSSFGVHLPVEVAALEKDASSKSAPVSTSFFRLAIPADSPDKIPI